MEQWDFDEEETEEDGFISAVFKAISLVLMFWIIIILSAAFI